MYQAYRSLPSEQFQHYLKVFGIELNKEQEREDVIHFIETLSWADGEISDFRDFYIGYKIPQISKEFDLLRLGENYHLNIEIKHESTQEKIQKQLRENRYYLRAISPLVFVFSFVVATQQVYTLDEEGSLSITTLEEVQRRIKEQRTSKIMDLDTLFAPKQYLVSPLNSTDKFMEQKYFLNNHQEEIKRDIINSFDKHQIKCALITGKPGTGKTLLTFDIARHYIEQYQNVVVIHCGILSDGHLKLQNKYRWNIYPIKGIEQVLENMNGIDLIVIDESQRIFDDQLKWIINYVSQRHTKCIFSLDPDQFFSAKENKGAFVDWLETTVTHKHYSLSQKIRTNKEIASFISNLLDKSKINTDPNFQYKNIYLQYFTNPRSVSDYLAGLMQEDWEVLNYTTSRFNFLSYDRYQLPGNLNAHRVIGQEFDKSSCSNQ